MIDIKQLNRGEVIRDNSLNLIRLLACIQVLGEHMQAHLELQLPLIYNRVIGLFHGVPIFFVLIYASIGRIPDMKTFFKKRVLRLYPELCGYVWL